MTKKLSLTTPSYLQLYSFFTVVAYGFFFFQESLDNRLNLTCLPIVFLLMWQSLFIIFFLIMNNKYIKPLSAALLFLNAVVFYFIYAYHTPVDDIMIMNALQTDKKELSELLNIKLAGIIIVMGVLPAVSVFCFRIIPVPFSQMRKKILHSFCVLIVIGLITYPCTNSFLHHYKYLQSYLPPINYIAGGTEVLIKKLTPHPPLQQITQDITLQPINGKPNLIIFIMGETSRAANFSLNGYHRPTNQALETYLPEIIYYPDVQSCGTSTAVAVPCIFSVYDQKHYKTGSEIYTENVLDIFSKAGYKINWLDNDGGCKNVCDRVRYSEPCDSKTCLDDILFDSLHDKLTEANTNRMIILHTRGSHGPSYHEHYDKQSNIYKPTCKRYDIWNCSQEELINVYDNTIHYVSKFIAETVKIAQSVADKYNPIIIYTSDHGESLKENGIFLHAAPYETAPKEQKEVPMLVWLPQNNGYHLDLGCLRKKANQAKYSHDNIFHSLLGLGKIKSQHYQKELDIFNGCQK